MDGKKQKRTVYMHSVSNEESIVTNATNRRVQIEHHPVPPRSPQKEVDNFDYLMGFVGDNETMK
jgi:hypothetical protein